MARRRAFDRSADHRTSRVTLVLAAVAVLAALGVVTLLAAIAPRGIPGVDYYVLKAEVKNSDDLRLLSPVYISGRRVGQVTKVTHTAAGVQLNLQIQSSEGPLRSDTTGRVRIKNPVGAKYFELTPGLHGDELPSGSVLSTKQTSNATDLDQVLSTFPTVTRNHLQDTISGLGKGFLGRGEQLNDMYTKTPRLLPDLDSVAKAVNARTGAAARLAPSAETLANAYDPVRNDLATGFTPQADVLDAFAAPGSRLQQTLTDAPASLAGIKRGLDASNPLLRQTARLSRATSKLTKIAPPALRETTKLLQEGQPALKSAKPVIAELNRAVPPTLSFLHALDPIVGPTIAGLQDQGPLLQELTAYRCDVIYMTDTWRSALSYGVPTGGDPLSNLDNNQGIGPNINSFRVLSIPPLNPQAFAADSPGAQPAASDANPAPCVAKTERSK